MSAPTLIVGLGGVGSDIVKRVYKRATAKQRKSISFVVFDTDVNELSQIQESNMNIHTIQVSAKMTVGEYLKFDENAKDKWFPVNRVLNSKVLTDGAGQVRAISRLAFNTALVQGKLAPLDDAIQELYKLRGDALTQAPRVIITGTLCGGTGSGLALPVCMYIRNYLMTKVQQGTSLMKGFFLLPEVFDGVIKGTSERNNLKCNAYAAIREIDAFMMKADGTLPEKFDLHFTIPRTNSQIEDEYTGSPMDYCFLFDGQNMNGMQLSSFSEYKEHAANCIYGMAIAPTSARSNSSEDNVIRDIVRARGRDRYAGSGTSLLIYPMDDVKRYLALRWTQDSISDDWLSVDKRFKEEQEQSKNRRRTGFSEQALDRGEHYIRIINEGVEENKAYQKSVRDMCVTYEDERKIIEKETSWDGYLSKLKEYLDNAILKEKDLLRMLTNNINSLREAANDEATTAHFDSLYEQLVAYKRITQQTTREMARNLIYSLFRDPRNQTKTESPYRLEYWLQKNHAPGLLIHPSAIRYVLYSILHEMRISFGAYSANVKAIEDFWAGFEKETFDIKATTDRVESKDEYMEFAKFNLKGMQRLIKKDWIEKNKKHLIQRFDALRSQTDEYWENSVMKDVYGAGISYIEHLCHAFEGFYDALDDNRVTVEEDISDLEREFEIKDGIALRYVCADKECLRGLAKEVVNNGDAIDLPGSLCTTIFSELRTFAIKQIEAESQASPDTEEEKDNTKKVSINRFCVNLFNETIVNHLKEQLQDQYDTVISMDVLSALGKEAEFKNRGETLTKEAKNKYVVDILRSTKELAKPFIESPRNKQARIIPACTYNPELEDPEKPIPGRKEFVLKNLRDDGGVPSTDIDLNMIMYYQAVYDLQACDLGKFAPPEKTQTTERQAGDYYKAYHELISELHPDPQKSLAITPHLNRWWHIITMMPDLNDDSQSEQEYAISKAFFWGMLGDYIRFVREKDGTQYYCPARTTLGLPKGTDEKLMVSNGTLCDKLYEVFDAFTIYPHLVDLVCKTFNNIVNKQIEDKVVLQDSILYRYLSGFMIDEYPLYDTAKKATDPAKKAASTDADAATKPSIKLVRSIFELPLLVKRSVPAELYARSNVDDLIDVMFKELYEYHTRFCAARDLKQAYNDFLKKQFDLFWSNVNMEDKACPKLELISDNMIDDLLERLENEILAHGMPATADEINQKRKKRAKYGNVAIDAFD